MTDELIKALAHLQRQWVFQLLKKSNNKVKQFLCRLRAMAGQHNRKGVDVEGLGQQIAFSRSF